jgi:hypothetical protein
MGIFDFLKKKQQPKKSISSSSVKKKPTKRSSKYQLIWKKNDTELVDLFHFLLKRDVLEKHRYFIERHEDDFDSRGSLLSKTWMRVMCKWDGTSLDISKKGHGLEFRGTDSQLTKLSLDSDRINWVLLNLNKSRFDIPSFIQKEKQNLSEHKNEILNLFDKDKNGVIDIIEENNEFNQLLKKHQKIIIEKGKEFNQNSTHQFIKVGNYIKVKRGNLQLIFSCIKNVQNQNELNEYISILENEIHSYNLLLFNSLNLIVSMIDDNQITFYEIYEKFDKLNIYNSNWENEMSQKLTTLNKGISELNSNIKGLMYEIRDMGDRIVDSIGELSYVTEESNRLLDDRLGEINSSIQTGNLLSLINVYQNYKINKNTKSLRG